MKRRDLRLGAKPPPTPFTSRRWIYSGKGKRLRKLTETTWIPAGNGIMRLRQDSYKMKANISKKEQTIFERSGIRFAKGARPYSHKISGIGREGPLNGTKAVHGIETRRAPGRILGAAAKGKLPKDSRGYRRFFRP